MIERFFCKKYHKNIVESGDFMGLIVQKFGGSSVENAEKISLIAKKIKETKESGNDVVVVVSAQGKTTDKLLEKAKEISKNPSFRELDVLLSAGEQVSISLLAMALQEIGCPAVSFCAWQIPIYTNNFHQNARILNVNIDKINKFLQKGNVVIVAGFQGIDKNGEITTLGRGGSDTTAVALAGALNADNCQIFTDVNGVFSADPRKIQQSVKISTLTYNDMLVLASMGAKVLHDRSVELAKEKNVKLEVLSSFNSESGSIICENVRKMPTIFSVTDEKNVISYKIFDINTANMGELMTELYRNEIKPDLSEQPKKNQLIFTINAQNKQRTEQILAEMNLKYNYDDSFSKVSLVGCGLHNIPNFKQECLEVLNKENINFQRSWLGERRFSVLVPRENLDKSLEVLHKLLLEYSLF